MKNSPGRKSSNGQPRGGKVGSSLPQGTPVPRRSSRLIIRKGFGVMPSAESIQRLFGPEPETTTSAEDRDAAWHSHRRQDPDPAPGSGDARSAGESSAHSEARPGAEPLAYGLWLFGPGADALREVVLGYAPFLDARSGTSMHWVVLGDPRFSQVEFRAFVEAQGDLHTVLDDEWRTLVADRRDDRNTIAVEGFKVAQANSLKPSDTPAVLLFAVGSQERPVQIRLPELLDVSVGKQRTAIDLLLDHFSEATLQRLVRKKGRGEARLIAILALQADRARREIDKLFQLSAVRPGSKTAQKYAAVEQHLKGVPLKKAAKQCGVSPQAIRKDPRLRVLLKQVRAARSSDPHEPAKGSKYSGRVERPGRPGDDADGS